MSRTVPLALTLSAADPRPLAKQLADGIRRAIAAGELAVGAQLPSVRALAEQLTLNPKTVAKVYAGLAAEGWLDAHPGLGLFVAAPRQRLSDAERARKLALAVDAFAADAVGLGFPVEHVLEQVRAALAPLNRRSA